MSVSDLTNTKWRFDNTILARSNSPTYVNVNGNVLNTTYTFSNLIVPLANYNYGGVLTSVATFNNLIQTSSGEWQIYNNDDEVVVESLGNSVEIEITGGSGTTNSTLISWLQANATQIQDTPTPNEYTITHSLTNLTKGNMTFTIVADTGYELPASSSDFTITNGTIVSYDSSTGVLVVNGDDTTTISCECGVATPSGYDLTINYTGNMSPALRVYVNKTPVSFDSTDYDYEFYYEDSPCIVSGLVANDYVYLLGQYGGRYDWTASSNVNCSYVDEEYGRFKVVISSDANASIDINFED